MIIAELAQVHDGSVGILHSLIDAIAPTGVDAIKFQTHIAEAESSAFEPFRVKFSYVDASRYDYWKRMQFSLEQWKEIKAHCENVGVEFMSSPFSNVAVEWLEELNVKRYKIGSGEVNNLLMLERISKTGKPVILSSGMSSFEELDVAYYYLKERGVDISVLQCTTSYPTPAERTGLNVISELKSRYNCKVGLSDHSGTIYPSIAAAALGAEIFEFHVTFDKRMFGPDASSSLTVDQVKQLVEGIRFVNIAMQNPVDKSNNEVLTDLKLMFEKSLAINKDLMAGHVITIDDLEAKKPRGYGIPASDFNNVIGKKLLTNKKQWSFLTINDIE